jgi:1-acyl-sn-glycerol-3-phosphate acyltransferase
MQLPPRWLRRLLIDPAVVLGVLVALVSLPVVVIAGAFLSRYVPGRWRIPRIVWFLFLYLLVEAASLIVMFLFWIASGFGWKLKEPFWERAHYTLFGWMLRRVVASAKFTFKISFLREGEAPRTVGSAGRRPILVLSRHAGPGDSMMLMDGLCNTFDRRPRIVLKEFMQWDPAIDVILNRLPSAFVPVVGKAGTSVLDAIRDIVGSMDNDDAFVIFPEGANYTERRFKRAVEKLQDIGRPDLAERASELKNTLPPRSTGVKTALGSAPAPHDVFFVGHAGLETFVSWGDIWRGMPMDTEVAVRLWHYPYEQVPAPEEQEAWLYDVWREIDEWIGLRMAETGEPFDDPAFY